MILKKTLIIFSNSVSDESIQSERNESDLRIITNIIMTSSIHFKEINFISEDLKILYIRLKCTNCFDMKIRKRRSSANHN